MTGTTKISYGQAIAEAIRMEMHRDAAVVCVGNGIAAPGRSPVTDGLLDVFGAERVVDLDGTGASPLAAALGFAARGMRALCEIRPEDLTSEGLALLGEAAGAGEDLPLVVRVPSGGPSPNGAAIPAGIEALLMDSPGISVAAPATPADAKGLTVAAIRRGAPVCMLEHESLYAAVDDVPEGGHETALGTALVEVRGDEATVIGYGLGAAIAREAVTRSDALVELVDLRTLRPLDRDAVTDSVGRTGKPLVVEPSGATRVGAEVAAVLLCDAFEHLDGPLERVEFPAGAGLEEAQRAAAIERVTEALDGLRRY